MNVTLIIKSQNYCWVTKTSELNNINQSLTRYMNELLGLNDPGYLLLARILLKKNNKYEDIYTDNIYNNLYYDNGVVVDREQYIKFLPQLESDILTLYTYSNN